MGNSVPAPPAREQEDPTMKKGERKQVDWAANDELVPKSCVFIDGAKNVELPMIGHAFSIAMTFILYSPKIFHHIRAFDI
ncbi:MAG: hypothetical protein U0525_05950 [Patescibacteria group bacterium]